MKSLKKNLIFLILISLIVIYMVFSYDFERTIEVLKTSKLIYIILGALVILIGDMLKGRSIYLLVSEYSSKYKFKDAFRLTLQTNFFNGITPFSLGGQPFQLYLLKKRNILGPLLYTNKESLSPLNNSDKYLKLSSDMFI